MGVLGRPLRVPRSNFFRPLEGLIIIPVGASLSGAEVEGIRGWRLGLRPLSAAMKFEVNAPVISDLSEGILVRDGNLAYSNRTTWLCSGKACSPRRGNAKGARNRSLIDKPLPVYTSCCVTIFTYFLQAHLSGR